MKKYLLMIVNPKTLEDLKKTVVLVTLCSCYSCVYFIKQPLKQQTLKRTINDVIINTRFPIIGNLVLAQSLS